MKNWKLPAACSLTLALLALLSEAAARLNPAVTLSREEHSPFDSDEASVSPGETVTTILHLGDRLRRIARWLWAGSLAAGAAGLALALLQREE